MLTSSGCDTSDPSSFNEAPIHESGKYYRKSFDYATISGFNEAPIHESGKYELDGEDALRSSCFNEAPIHESGKFPYREAPELDEEASMRPRFMNRGSLVDAAGEIAEWQLQ